MSLLPRAFHHGDSSSFTPLFRLLDDFDNYRQGDGLSHGGEGKSGSVFWQPKFDIRESGDQYELHGEFPGLNKDDIHIEFPEPQTLVVRGKSERTYSDSVPSSSVARIEDVSNKAAIAEGDNGREARTTENSREHSNKPQYWFRERRFGEFSRTFSFPSPVEQDGISASLKDGVLFISVPKAKKPQPRRIAIN